MKYKKGEVATLLTLGLVLVGGLVTLGLSLLSNNQKNIAMNPKAVCVGAVSACTPAAGFPTGNGKPFYVYGGKYYTGKDCSGLIPAIGTYCKSTTPIVPPGGSGVKCKYPSPPTLAQCPNGSTQVGCTSDTYQCKTGTVPGATTNACENKGASYHCLPMISTNPAVDNCAPNTFVGMGLTLCGDVSQVCCKGNAQQSGNNLINQPSSTSTFQCSSGNPVVANGTCSSTCESKGSKYVSNSQGDGSDGKHYCCCSKTEAGSGFDTCYKAYRSGMYGCAEGENKVVVYAQSMAAADMPSCSAYNKGSTTALYFAQTPGAYGDGGCYAGVWDDNMDLDAKNQQAQDLTSPIVDSNLQQCKDGSIAQCTFGEGDESTKGPGVCKGKTEQVVGCISVPSNKKCSYFGDIYECTAAQMSGQSCAWDNTNSKCIDSSVSVVAPIAHDNCTAVSCQKLDTRYANKNYFEMKGKLYQENSCSKGIANNNDLALFCAGQAVGFNLTNALDNVCVSATKNPLAYCNAAGVGPVVAPFKNLPCKNGYKFSGATCNAFGSQCCVPKDDVAQACVKKNCQDLSNKYAYKGYFQNNGKQYSNLTDCSNGTNSMGDLVMYCSQNIGIQASVDNSCKDQTGDPQAYCNNKLPFGFNFAFTTNMPCRSGFMQASSARCQTGLGTTVCCIQKKQEVPGSTVVECKGAITYDNQGNLICTL